MSVSTVRDPHFELYDFNDNDEEESVFVINDKKGELDDSDHFYDYLKFWEDPANTAVLVMFNDSATESNRSRALDTSKKCVKCSDIIIKD